MKIDPSIYAAIAAGTLSREQVLGMTLEVVLEHVAAEAVATGFAEADVKLVIEKLRKNRPVQFETVRQMLQAGATSVQ